MQISHFTGEDYRMFSEPLEIAVEILALLLLPPLLPLLLGKYTCSKSSRPNFMLMRPAEVGNKLFWFWCFGPDRALPLTEEKFHKKCIYLVEEERSQPWSFLHTSGSWSHADSEEMADCNQSPSWCGHVCFTVSEFSDSICIWQLKHNKHQVVK